MRVHARDQRRIGERSLQLQLLPRPIDGVGQPRFQWKFIDEGGQTFDLWHLAPVDGQKPVARFKLLFDARKRAHLVHHQRIGGHAANAKDRGEDQDREDEVEDRTCGDRGRARPKRRARHGGAGIDPGRVGAPDAGRVRIPAKLDVTARRNGRDLPARAAPVHAREQHRTHPDRENIGVDAGPAAHDVMPVFVDRDDDRKGGDKSEYGKSE